MIIGAIFLLSFSLICFLAITFQVFRSLLVFIEPDKRGVVLSPWEASGYRQEILEPGWHLISLGEEVRLYQIVRQTYTMSAPDSIKATTLDGKTIFVDTSVIYALDPKQLLNLQITWQDRYEDSLVRPLSRSTTREVVSLYNFNDLETQPANIEKATFAALSTKFSENYLILIKFKIISVHQ
jgi:regulator of protease activity HflC (stomatin/prohibitin superfamily)